MDGITSGYSTKAASGANATGKSSNASVLQELKKQYPHLKLSAQSFASEAAVKSYAMGQSGKYNVAIHPKALANMENDPKLAAKVHETLGLVKELNDRSEQRMRAKGATEFSTGTIIGENGEVSMWTSVSSESESDSPGLFATGKNSDDLMKKLDEKRQERLAGEKRLEKKRQEADTAEAAAEESLNADISIDVNASGAAAKPSAPSGNGTAARVDFTA